MGLRPWRAQSFLRRQRPTEAGKESQTVGSPQQAKLVTHMKFKSPVAAHMLQVWKCIYLYKHFALWVLSVSGFRRVVAKLAVTKWRY